MRRGKFRGLAGAVCAATLLTVAAAGTAEAKPSRVLFVNLSMSASNGYYLDLSGFRGQPGGATATASFYGEDSSVTYLKRRPAQVTKRRLRVDFGELGQIDLRFKPLDRQEINGPCGRDRVAYGRFKGGLHLEGENGFSHVRTARLDGIVQTTTGRGQCGDAVPFRDHRESRERILTACGGDSGAAFGAARSSDSRGSFFLGSKRSTFGDLEVVSTAFAEGPTRRFAVRGKSARVSPPEPFAGRARLRGGRLTGDLRVTLPGEGRVRLTPGEGQIGGSDAEFPKCFPFLLVRDASGPSVGAALARSVQSIALPPRARRLFAG